MMDVQGRAKEIINIERDALTRVGERLDASFERAVDLILSATGRVVVTGMGKSGLIGSKISSTLSSVGTPSFFLHPAEAIHGDLGMLRSDDVVLAISYSGESEEIVRLLPILKRFGISLIALTGRKDSSLGKTADVWLDVSVKVEACPWDVVPTSSTTAALAMGDALALVVMEKKGFSRDDFLKHHPGGSLGRGLLVKVGDLMRTGNRIPAVKEGVTLNAVIQEMSDKKMGFTLVTDNNGKVTGIITDGDLRRLLERDANPQTRTAGEIMSGKPRTVDGETMGGAALKQMEDNKITSLVVLDQHGGAEGVLHLHDLLRAGVR